jgi:uncharacterized membrane protein YfcA
MTGLFPILIFLSGILSGFLNTVAGGGSLLVLPLLVFSGLDMGIANATNRVAILLQSVTASRSFIRQGTLDVREILPTALPAVIGSLAGTFVAIQLDERLLRVAIALMISVMAGLLVFRPAMWEEKRAVRLPGWLSFLIFFLIGIYGGFIQAGVGFFLIWALAGIGGRDLVEANGAKVFIVGCFTAVSLALFASNGMVRFGTGLILACGSMIGAHAGARFTMAKGNRVIRFVLAVTVMVSAAKMLWDAFGGA